MAKIFSAGVDNHSQFDELPFQRAVDILGLRKDGCFKSEKEIPVHPASDFGRNRVVYAKLEAEEAKSIPGWEVGCYLSKFVLEDAERQLNEAHQAK